MKTITNTRFDEERALYGAQNVLVRDCAFDGPADGESAFKESSDVTAEKRFQGGTGYPGRPLFFQSALSLLA